MIVLSLIRWGLSSWVAPLGTLQRINLNLTPLQAEAIFYWGDELLYDQPKDMKPVPANAGERPWMKFVQADGVTINYNATSMPAGDHRFSWFLTVTPATSESALPWAQKRLFSVAVVVCYQREFTAAGERAATATLSPISYGGGTIMLNCNVADATPLVVKENEWILLYSAASGQCSWYRAVSSATIAPGASQALSLVGPDWYGGATAAVVVIPGVTGVYSTTVRLDQ